MSELREEVIKLLQEELERYQRAPELNGCEMKPEWQKTMDVCRVAVEAIREQEQRRWIPVTERLPQNYIAVLVYLPGERPLTAVHEAYIGGDGAWHSSVVYGVENEDVTHWMPMPEPQKEGANNGW